MKRLLIVANRLPIRFEKTATGLKMCESEGGLATGLASLSSTFNKEWIGWPGVYINSEEEKDEVISSTDKKYHPVFLDKKDVDLYYKGFSNETLWPLFHYFMESTNYKSEYWDQYQLVNKKFCDRVVEVAKEGDVIWIQDYHLMLLPGMLREKLNNSNPIGFFLHIPFVSFELFRTLPWRRQLLDGVLGADLIGFHTFEYVRHFIDTVYRVKGYECRLGSINIDGRLAYAESFPMGINFQKFSNASENAEVIAKLQTFRERFGRVKLVLSVDRLDYTKGIVNRLRSFDSLLNKFPDHKEKVSLIMLTVPSRDDVHEYKNLKEEVDELVGNINGRHSTLSWTPVHYFYRSVPFNELVALYNLADIGLVTPLRDGMNLVAKEFVASKNSADGVLILSEMAGAAIELDGALRINPNDQSEMADAMHTALGMSAVEQEERMTKMRRQVKVNSVEKWANDFTLQLNGIFEQAKKIERTVVTEKETATICASFAEAEERLIILDYDGTLMPFFNNPFDARPTEDLMLLLDELCKNATVVLVSGRDHVTMEEWFGHTRLNLVAEHGVWFKESGEWKQSRELSSAWKSDVFPVLESYVEKTPGSFIEEKPYSLAFHYRRSDSWLAEIRTAQLMTSLSPVCTANTLNILDGNKVIEIRIPGVDKGNASQKWLAHRNWDFVLTIGDDKTDEDMFNVMPEHAFTIKVGTQPSMAKLRVKNSNKVKELLQHIIMFSELQKNQDMKLVYKRAM